MGVQNRIIFVDVLKCFTIFLVVWQHYASFYSFKGPITAYLSQTVLAFHMPLFALLSGMFFSDSLKPIDFIKNKSRQLLVPFLSWIFISEVIIWGVIKLYQSCHGGDSFHFGGIANGVIGSIVDSRLWFLKALFLCFIYGYASLKIGGSNKIRSLVFSNILLYTISLLGVLPNNCSLINGGIFLYPFFCFGYILKLKKSYIEENSDFILIVSFALFMFLRFFWHGFQDCFYYMNTSVFAQADVNGNEGFILVYKTIFRFIIGCAGSLFFFTLFFNLFKNVSHNKITEYLQSVGQNTLIIYVLHSYLFEFWHPDRLGANNLTNALICLLLTFIVMASSVCFAKIIRNNKSLKLFLLGK